MPISNAGHTGLKFSQMPVVLFKIQAVDSPVKDAGWKNLSQTRIAPRQVQSLFSYFNGCRRYSNCKNTLAGRGDSSIYSCLAWIKESIDFPSSSSVWLEKGRQQLYKDKMKQSFSRAHNRTIFIEQLTH